MKPDKKAQNMSTAELAAYIDQSVLKPEFTQEDIKRYIQEGINYGCKTVCINPASIDIARGMCKGTKTGLCVVCDFPFGLSTTASKIQQIHEICKNGDIEDLDIVSNYGWIRSGLWTEFEAEIRALTEAVHKHGTTLKVIFETDALTMDEVAKATDICCKAGVDYVKTSTGFYTGGENKGTTFELVKVMMDAAQGRCKIKGAGGIRDREKFLKLIDLGIDRMGIGYRSTPVVLGVSVEDIRS
jgi:deoxyribose-phosphate aldolase